jgi:hypothetical protein
VLVIGPRSVTGFLLNIQVPLSTAEWRIPLKRVVTRAKEIASGDLTGNAIETVGNDELPELSSPSPLMI